MEIEFNNMITGEKSKMIQTEQSDGSTLLEQEDKYKKFKKDLEIAVNKNSMENYCNIPDFIIAEYLVHCFYYNLVVEQRLKVKDGTNNSTIKNVIV